MTGGEIPPHRHLFHAYTYQYHLMEFSVILISTVRRDSRFYFLILPDLLLSSSTSWNWSSSGSRHGSGSPRYPFPISLVGAYGITASILSMKMTRTPPNRTNLLLLTGVFSLFSPCTTGYRTLSPTHCASIYFWVFPPVRFPYVFTFASVDCFPLSRLPTAPHLATLNCMCPYLQTGPGLGPVSRNINWF